MTWHTFWQRKHSMHLRNSWLRSTSSCCIRRVPSASLGRGLKAGISLARSKLKETSVARSRYRGKVLMGDTVTVSPGSKVSMRVMHMRRGLPLISALHEPHLPALQFHRQARSGACVAWSVWITSSTTMPSCAGTWYSRKAPALASPRHTRIVTLVAATLLSLLAERLELIGDRRDRVLLDAEAPVLPGQHDVHGAPAVVGERVVVARVAAAALLALDRPERRGLGDREHRVQVQRQVPAGIERAPA